MFSNQAEDYRLWFDLNPARNRSEKGRRQKSSLPEIIRKGTILLEQKQFRLLFALAESLSATYNGG